MYLFTHWGRMTHICVSKLTLILSDSGLSPGRRHAVILTTAGMLLIGLLPTHVSDILIKISIFSLKNPFENVVWKVTAILSRPQSVNLSSLASTVILGGHRGVTKMQNVVPNPLSAGCIVSLTWEWAHFRALSNLVKIDYFQLFHWEVNSLLL